MATPAQPVRKNTSFSMGRRLSGARAKEFSLVSKFNLGYRNREDKTMLPSNCLVEGSKNVLTNTAGRVGSAKGFTLDGAASTVNAPILSAFDFETSNGFVRNLRGYLDPTSSLGVLQYRYDNGTTISWNTLKSDMASGLMRFTGDYWDTTELLNKLLFVDGSTNLYDWSGAITTFASASNSNVIFIAGNSASLTAAALSTTSSSLSVFYNGLAGTNFKGQLTFTTQPIAGDTITLTYNATPITITFVSTIGAVAGNVLIGATLANTVANLNGLLLSPGTTNTTQVALSAGNQTLVGYTTDSISAHNLTTQGVKTWSELGFYQLGVRSIVIGGVTATYTGGEDTTTLTGVSVDFSATPVGSVIVQGVRTNPNSNLTAFPANFNSSLISVVQGQVYIGSATNASVYISKYQNYLDYSFTKPLRVVGEGQVVTLDAPPTGFRPQEDVMYLTAGLNYWYNIVITLSADLLSESMTVARLKTNQLQAAQSQEFITHDKNDIIFLSKEPVLNSLGRVAGVITTPQMTDLSYSIINDFNAYDFTDGCADYFKNFVLVAIPQEGLIRIYNQTNPKDIYWEAPLTYPVSRFYKVNGELYGHSYNSVESYKLLDGYNFNGEPIPADAVFAFDAHGVRSQSKSFDEWFVDGYISQNGVLTIKSQADLDGCAAYQMNEIDGSDTAIVCISGSDASLGKVSLGKNPLGSSIGSTTNTPLPPNFRAIKTFNRVPFYLNQLSFSSSALDFQWEITSFGTNASMTSESNNAITE